MNKSKSRNVKEKMVVVWYQHQVDCEYSMEMRKSVAYFEGYLQEDTEVTSIKKKKLQRFKMNDGEKMNRMTKKLPNGHNIGGSAKQKRRKENKQKSNKNEE